MAGTAPHTTDCGCCAGIDRETPRRIANTAGMSAIAYRVGTWAQFKESMLTRLSSSSTPALAGLSTRADDDFTIALCDALAMSLDVLTFYQERIANEHYLRTATERRSMVEMARLIGYQPAPGVAASTYLAFTLHETPGDPASTPVPIRVPVGTRVQSVPGQDEQPQSFETVAEVEARAEWNSIRAQQTRRWRPAHGDTDLYLDGLDTRLKAGHAILIVGEDRRIDSGSQRWDVRVLAAVEEDRDNGRTRVMWDDPLGHDGPHSDAASGAVQVFALRTRAALFGHNAPDPRLMSRTGSRLRHLVTGSAAGLRWANYAIGTTIDLDRAYPGVTTGSWLALVSNEEGYGTPSLPGYTELYRAAEVNEVSRTDFALSAKISRVQPDTAENLTRYGLQQTLVLAESEELATTPRPLLYPVYGDLIASDTPVAGLYPGQALAVRGVRQRIAIAPGVNDLVLTTDAGLIVNLSEGDSLVLVAAPAEVQGGTPIYRTPEEFGLLVGDTAALLRLTVVDRDGVAGTLLGAGIADPPRAGTGQRSVGLGGRRHQGEFRCGQLRGGAHHRAAGGPARTHLPPRQRSHQRQRGSGDTRRDGRGDSRWRRRRAAGPAVPAPAGTADLRQRQHPHRPGVHVAGAGQRPAVDGGAHALRTRRGGTHPHRCAGRRGGVDGLLR